MAQQMHDGAEIHYLTKNRFKSILEPNPFIQKVYGIEKSTNEVVDQLKEERYDYIIDLHRNLRSARVKKALRMLSFSFRKLNWEKWLLVNFGINRMPDIHIVDRYMETLKIFKIENDNKGLDYFIPESEDLWPEFVPQHIRENYVALVISATHWRKKPRMNQYIRLCRETTKNIILLGGPSEQEEGKEISEKGGASFLTDSSAFGSSYVICLCGISALSKSSLNFSCCFRGPPCSCRAAGDHTRESQKYLL